MWGCIFVEYWKHEQIRLTREWNCANFEKQELDRVEYAQKLQQYRVKRNDPYAEFSECGKKFKYFVSLFMTVLVV